VKGVWEKRMCPLFFVAFLFITACSNESEIDARQNKEVAPKTPEDLEDSWDFSSSQLAALRARAAQGDMEAGHKLYVYYSIKSNTAERKKWQRWLADRGDRNAILDIKDESHK
jgi:hypothetical protein